MLLKLVGSILLVNFLHHYVNNFRKVFFDEMYINMSEKSTVDNLVTDEKTMIT